MATGQADHLGPFERRDMPDWNDMVGPVAGATIAALLMAVDVVAAAHAILHKRDVSATIGWVGVIWLAPVVGVLAYLMLGVNRIERKAARLRIDVERVLPGATVPVASVGDRAAPLEALRRVVDQVTLRPLLPGNRLEPLVDGDVAYPRMLEAIEAAKHSITLVTYIFDHDPVGLRFVDALRRARARGVEVRVLVDYAGSRYSHPTIDGVLREAGVTVARFMPAWRPRRFAYINLRNHRKIMVVDGHIGFTGGMNIRRDHLMAEAVDEPTRDLHFRIEGPVVAHLQSVVAEDWHFSTNERLEGELWFPALDRRGDVAARGIADGPDEDRDKFRWTLLGALGCAQSSFRVVTPYFLPDFALTNALQVAALRGVEVDIVIPERGNLPFVQWAMWAHLRLVLGRGCRVWMTPAPFDHTKICTVDGEWTLLGSANWDPRSLRLNFEFGVECYDRALAASVGSLIDERIRRSRRITEATLAERSLPVRLRDGVAHLLSPYL